MSGAGDYSLGASEDVVWFVEVAKKLYEWGDVFVVWNEGNVWLESVLSCESRFYCISCESRMPSGERTGGGGGIPSLVRW